MQFTQFSLTVLLLSITQLAAAQNAAPTAASDVPKTTAKPLPLPRIENVEGGKTVNLGTNPISKSQKKPSFIGPVLPNPALANRNDGGVNSVLGITYADMYTNTSFAASTINTDFAVGSIAGGRVYLATAMLPMVCLLCCH